MSCCLTSASSLNIFLGLREQNVTFCIDISGSMYSSLNIIKEQLIQYLLEQSLITKFNLNRLFNLVAFSSEVYPWSNGVVLWNTATVNSCLDWIKDLETKTGTNTLDALLTAFQDQNTHACVLVTDDICDQDASTVLNQVSLISRGRPVHCIYLSVTGREEDKNAIEFLQNLATITHGSFKIVSIGRYGVERITPIYCFDPCATLQMANLSLNAPSLSNFCPISFNNSVTSLISETKSSFFYPSRLVEPTNYAFPNLLTHPRIVLTNEDKLPSHSIAWSRFRPVRFFHDGTVCGLSSTQSLNLPLEKDIAYTPDIGKLLQNKSVLARSTLDGYYYKGKVLNQILAHRFNIQFGPNTHGKYKDCFYQDTPIYDIISYDDALVHSVKTHDKAMALIDGIEKYAPCDVLEGEEDRSNNKCLKALTVRFANGSTRTLPSNEAIWIPDAVYDRISFEFNLPSTARKYLEDYNDEYPNKSLPGCPNLKNVGKPKFVVMPRMIYDIWPYYVPFYPLYSNILHATSTAKFSDSGLLSTLSLSNTMSLPQTTHAAVYGRQIKSKPAAVNSDCVNRNVIGSYMTPEQLDEKIRQQIQNHRHLLENENRSRSRTRSCCGSRSRSASRCSYNENMQNHQSRRVSSCSCSRASSVHSDYHNDSHENFYNFKHNNHHHHHHQPNSHHRSQLHNHHHNHSHHSHHGHNENNLLRSKSVTFLDEYYDYDFIDTKNEASTNTDVTFSSKKLKTPRPSSNFYSGVPDRFGNPKACIGLPDRPMRRPRSASSSLDYSLVEKINQTIQEEIKKSEHKRNNVVKREDSRKENLANEIKKENLKNQYHQSKSKQFSDSEKVRTDAVFNKNEQRNQAKREIHAFTSKRVESCKTDIESKEQAKYDYLRNQVNKRNADRLNFLQDNASKDANKIAFKKNQQLTRDKAYHDRILYEEAARQVQQKQLDHFHSQAKKNEKLRENKEQRIQSHKKYVKENNLVKTQNNFLQTF